MGVVIEEVREYSADVEEAFLHLLPQLISGTANVSKTVVAEVIQQPGLRLFLARDEEGLRRILGMASLVLYRIPTGLKASVEDVVVDGEARGRGVGEALMRALIEQARAEGAAALDLTSRPERAAANRLYQRLGFQLRQTNVYRMELAKKEPRA